MKREEFEKIRRKKPSFSKEYEQRQIKMLIIWIVTFIALILIYGYGGSFSEFHKKKLKYLNTTVRSIGVPSTAFDDRSVEKRKVKNTAHITNLGRIFYNDFYIIRHNITQQRILNYYEKKMKKLGWHKIKPIPRYGEYRWCGNPSQAGGDVLATLSIPPDDERITKETYPVYFVMKWTYFSNYCD